jgi:uncharacterized protein YndB with AHSA1/START domain
MTPPEDAPRPRTIDLEIEVPGTPEQVWAAIATGPGITAWMHPTELEEREGGSFSFDMGAGMTGSGTVTEWEPPHRFVQEIDWPGGDVPARLATEWRVEARAGGTCVVRMVMSGFGTGADWDDEIAGMGEGMRLALELLQLYLAHFPGRHAAWVKAFGAAKGSPPEQWAALAGALGVGGAAEGTRVDTGGAGGPALAGVVERVVDWRWHRGVLLRIEAPAPGLAAALVFGDQGWATVQAALYADDAAAIAGREEPAWQAWMAAEFPPAEPAPRAGQARA